MIRAGDTVKHGPTGETWLVALDESEGRVFWCGYPFGGNAESSDCTVIERATDAERREQLLKTFRSGDGYMASLAREQIRVASPQVAGLVEVGVTVKTTKQERAEFAKSLFDRGMAIAREEAAFILDCLGITNGDVVRVTFTRTTWDGGRNESTHIRTGSVNNLALCCDGGITGTLYVPSIPGNDPEKYSIDFASESTIIDVLTKSEGGES